MYSSFMHNVCYLREVNFEILKLLLHLIITQRFMQDRILHFSAKAGIVLFAFGSSGSLP